MDEYTVDLPEVAHRLRVPYARAMKLVLTGQLRAKRENGRYHVNAADVARLEAAQRGNAADSFDGATDVPAAYNALRQNVLRAHLLRAELEVVFGSILADAAEAEQEGDNERAQVHRNMARWLREARYTYHPESGRWSVAVPQLGEEFTAVQECVR